MRGRGRDDAVGPRHPGSSVIHATPYTQVVLAGVTQDGEPWCTTVLSNQPQQDGWDDPETDGVQFPFNPDLVGGTWHALVLRAVMPHRETATPHWQGVAPDTVPDVFRPFLRSCGALATGGKPAVPDCKTEQSQPTE